MKTDEGISMNQRSRARAMRGAPTEAELRLWRLLRDRCLNGLKFRRQVPIGPYIVDFLCIGAKLIVEADGFQHAENPRDNVRDAYLASQGWKVLRFWNGEVFHNPQGVLETILSHAELPKQSEPSSVAPLARHPSPEGKGWSKPRLRDPFSRQEEVDARSAAG
jgi:very-short-patch-repair endonuclease